MSNKDWTDKLPELLDNYTETEPEGLWDAVLAGVSPKKRRIPVAWWYAGGSLLAAAAVSAVFFLHPTTTVPSVTAVPGDLVAEAPASPAPTTVILSPAPEDRTEESPVIEEEIAEQVGDDVSVDVADETVVEVEEEAAIEEAVEEISVSEEKTVEEKVEETAEEVKEIKEVKEYNRVKRVPSLKAQISMSTTGYLGQMATNTFTGVGIPSNPGIRPDAVPVTKASSDGTSNESAVPRMLSRNKASTTQASHYMASRLALGATISLTEHWGVETGIVSSALTSVFNTEAGNSTGVTTRTMKYLGIPLYARYNAFQWRRLSLYLNAGPMYEYSMGTHTESRTTIGYKGTGQNTDNTLIPDQIWSLNAGGGIQLRIFNHGALYVLPGVSYHFPGDKTLENFYTEHPASFSLTFGYNFVF